MTWSGNLNEIKRIFIITKAGKVFEGWDDESSRYYKIDSIPIVYGIIRDSFFKHKLEK